MRRFKFVIGNIILFLIIFSILFSINVLAQPACEHIKINAYMYKSFGEYVIKVTTRGPSDLDFDYMKFTKEHPPPYKIDIIVYVDGSYLTEKTGYTNDLDKIMYIKLGSKPEPGVYTVFVKIYDSNSNLVCEASDEAGTISRSFWDDPIVKYAIIVGIFIVIAAAVKEYIRQL